jgi:hypothetical protein
MNTTIPKFRPSPIPRSNDVPIRYKGTLVGMHRMGLVVDDKVVVELKVVKDIDDAQLATRLSLYPQSIPEQHRRDAYQLKPPPSTRRLRHCRHKHRFLRTSSLANH